MQNLTKSATCENYCRHAESCKLTFGFEIWCLEYCCLQVCKLLEQMIRSYTKILLEYCDHVYLILVILLHAWWHALSCNTQFVNSRLLKHKLSQMETHAANVRLVTCRLSLQSLRVLKLEQCKMQILASITGLRDISVHCCDMHYSCTICWWYAFLLHYVPLICTRMYSSCNKYWLYAFILHYLRVLFITPASVADGMHSSCNVCYWYGFLQHQVVICIFLQHG
jgi:hypothetical protein